MEEIGDERGEGRRGKNGRGDLERKGNWKRGKRGLREQWDWERGKKRLRKRKRDRKRERSGRVVRGEDA